ncbi:uncharacterized protein LOC121833119 [Ixodes scapularis]|uniref:uncharacterized protein LOC121833119 n=1 Tax=Ixodes scapularis TaxID=6945 RepID=UPI001C38FC79|nr:uncharacterized protein LOC121833119 [Ixodes scapularis]
MGRCCVPKCRGNYDNGPEVRLFSFPRDVKRIAEWQRAVRRRDVDVGLLKDPKVCERHFKPDHLRTTSTYTDCDGRTIEAPMKLTRLTPDAFPAIFPDCPSYISDARKSREEPEVKRKRTENEQLQKTIQESLTAFEEEEKQHKVHNLCELISRVNEQRDRKFWCTTACETCLIFFAHIEPALQAPELLVSVVVSQDLSVRVYFKCAPLVSDDVCIPGDDVRVRETCLIFAHIEPALQAPELLVSVVVSQDLSVRVYFKCAPLVSDDVCNPGDEVRVRETCLIFAHIEPALQAPELLVSVVVSQDLSVHVHFKYAPLVSDDVCIPGEIRDVRVLDNLLDDVEGSIEKKTHQQEDKVGRMLELAFSLLDDICDDELHDDERADALIFLKEQC